MIARGTTPTIRYTFSLVDVSAIVVAYLTIKQGSLVIEKDLTSATIGDGYLDLALLGIEYQYHELGWYGHCHRFVGGRCHCRCGKRVEAFA